MERDFFQQLPAAAGNFRPDLLSFERLLPKQLKDPPPFRGGLNYLEGLTS